MTLWDKMDNETRDKALCGVHVVQDGVNYIYTGNGMLSNVDSQTVDLRLSRVTLVDNKFPFADSFELEEPQEPLIEEPQEPLIEESKDLVGKEPLIEESKDLDGENPVVRDTIGIDSADMIPGA